MRNRSRILFFATTVIVAVTTAAASYGQEPEAELGQFEFSGDSIALPATSQNGHLKVNVDFGDGVSRLFTVDTGAPVNVIDSGVAESFAYEIIGETEIGAPGGPKIPANIVKVPLARIGDGTIVDAEFVTMDMVGFSGGAMMGVISMGLFRDYLLAFDYGENEVRLSRESLSADSADVMPYDFTTSHIQIDIDVAGTKVASHIDTGSMGGFTLPFELKGSLPFLDAEEQAIKARLVGGNRDIQFARLDGDVLFAGATYEDPDLAFIEPSFGYGNVGSRILREYVMSIDQAKQLLRFEKLAVPTTAATGISPRRLGVQFRGVPGGGVLTVGHVEPGSLAQESGIMPGDVLRKLNDKPTEEFDMTSLGELFRSSEPLRFEIDRDGRMQTIEIQ